MPGGWVTILPAGFFHARSHHHYRLPVRPRLCCRGPDGKPHIHHERHHMKTIAILLAACIALATLADTADAGHRKPLRKGLKAAAKLVLPCR